MGVYATFDDVQYGGPRDGDEPCTACRGRGYVTYPVNVGVEVNEYDACPYGCEEEDPEELPAISIPDWWPTRFERTTPTYGAPYEAERRRTRDMSGYWQRNSLRVPGRVTTDHPVTGWLNDCKAVVPAYLVGTPVALDKDFLTVRYEYLGKEVDIDFYGVTDTQFRFAYWYEEGQSTKEVLG